MTSVIEPPTVDVLHPAPGVSDRWEGAEQRPGRPFAAVTRTRDHVVAIGIGAGSAAVLSLVEELDAPPGHALVILRGSRAVEIYGLQEIYELCRAKGYQFSVLLGHRDPEIRSWLPREVVRLGYALANFAPQLRQADLFVDGPQPAVDLAIMDARRAGVAPDQIHRRTSAGSSLR